MERNRFDRWGAVAVAVLAAACSVSCRMNSFHYEDSVAKSNTEIWKEKKRPRVSDADKEALKKLLENEKSVVGSVPLDEPDERKATIQDSVSQLNDALDRCSKSADGTSSKNTVPVDAGRREENVLSRVFEPLGILTVPGALLYEGLRWLVLEDFDSVFEGSNYVAFVDYDETPKGTIDDGDSDIDIYVEHLYVDNFTEGRWRDSLGGNGEELTLQVSANGLTSSGSLIREDTQFLIEKAVQLRDPALALVAGNARGAKLVAKYNKVAEKALDFADKQAELMKKAHEWWETNVDQYKTGEKAELIKKASAKLRELLEKELGDAITKSGANDDFKKALREAGGFVIDEIVRWFEKKLGAIEVKDWTGKLLDRIDEEVGELLGYSEALAKWASRYSVSEEGLVETIQAVQGLASADRLMVLPFNGVRPGLVEDQVLGTAVQGGTATRLMMRGTWEDKWYINASGRYFHPDSAAQVPGLVYRGKVRDVAATGDAAGITISTLLLELDSDELVKLLRYAQAFVPEGASIGGGATEVAASAVLDAATIVAEKIAQNDVELKSIDLRFLPRGTAEKLQGSPGTQIFELRPCRILVARNFHGTEFGAFTVIRIERSTPSPAAPPAHP